MRGKYRPHHIFEVVLLFIALAGFSERNSKANENSKYLDAVREFADNVLKYGTDTYGPKHTPLFVDGLNIHTHETHLWFNVISDEVAYKGLLFLISNNIQYPYPFSHSTRAYEFVHCKGFGKSPNIGEQIPWRYLMPSHVLLVSRHVGMICPDVKVYFATDECYLGFL